MKIAVSGSSGLIGRALCEHLREAGHQIITLVREERQASDATHCWWRPESGLEQPHKLAAGVDVVVHLAGRGIAEHRWNEREKERLRSSRVDATERLCRDLSRLATPPQAFLSASAVGIYGDCGDAQVTETHRPGAEFLSKMAADWEAASQPLAAVGSRLVHARFGIVLSRRGGALAKILPLFRWGLGSRLGTGRQYWSWIALEDTVRALEWLATRSTAHGPFNIVAPEPVTNAEFTRSLARAVHRPQFLPVPATALRIAVGEMADAALLASCRAVPERLQTEGFSFQAPTLAEALERILHAKPSHDVAG
jgi:uncharacterized protein